jgi:rubrerythrin
MAAGLTRRRALAGATAAATLAACGDGGDDGPARRGGPGSGVGLLNSVLALEHATVAAYDALAALLAGRAREQAMEIAAQEREHVRLLARLVREAGGTPVGGRRARDYRPSFPRLDGPRDALLFAQDLEERLVRAHLDALSKLPAGPLRRGAGALATSEAEHLTLVSGLLGEPPLPDAFVTGTS